MIISSCSKYQKKKKSRERRTLREYDCLVAGIFGDSELFNQGEHFRAWLHVVVTSAPGGDGALTRFFDLFIRNGRFSLLA
jgi:hypothetical protein